MSEQREDPLAASVPLTIDELAHVEHVDPLSDPKELAADIWDSDEELKAFLADLRSSRDASLGGVQEIR